MGIPGPMKAQIDGYVMDIKREAHVLVDKLNVHGENLLERGGGILNKTLEDISSLYDKKLNETMEQFTARATAVLKAAKKDIKEISDDVTEQVWQILGKVDCQIENITSGLNNVVVPPWVNALIDHHPCRRQLKLWWKPISVTETPVDYYDYQRCRVMYNINEHSSNRDLRLAYSHLQLKLKTILCRVEGTDMKHYFLEEKNRLATQLHYTPQILAPKRQVAYLEGGSSRQKEENSQQQDL